MVRGLAMESQDKRMCKTESTYSGVTVDYNQNHRVYDEDCFGDILNMFDFPMEGLETDGFAEDWASKLGPIPSEVFKELGVNNTFVPSTELPFDYPVINAKTSQAFEAPSPNSVLETRTSSSNSTKPVISFGIQHSIPVKTRSKRFRPTTNPWLLSPLITKEKKRKTPSQIPVFIKRSNVTGIKKCAHCEITKTPQWREGPMGPKTLCNACGVRYRSGRLFPEYRPAASPTFIPALHSNSHRKVIEMRRKTV
ncbi:hypothetical protein L1887_09973 [Cichorium endivia]|nr:hypothetical protein L1887_09973 [Cichorium endivia]